MSDPSVAYDAEHDTWLISSIPLLPSLSVPTVFVSRSTDGGATFGAPVQIPPPAAKKVDLDKNWTVCDNHPASPFYGHCYTEFDNFGEGDLEYMSTSRDGGRTWSTPVSPAGQAQGPRRPAGRAARRHGRSCRSRASRARSRRSARPTAARPGRRSPRSPRSASTRRLGRPADEPAAERRDRRRRQRLRRLGGLPLRAEVRGQRHRASARSDDGVDWSPVSRIPIDAVGSGVDHFIPGLAVDPATSGASAHLALTYYFYPRRRLHAGDVPARRRLHLLARRRGALGRADAARRADVADRHRRRPRRARWSATTSRRRSTPPARRRRSSRSACRTPATRSTRACGRRPRRCRWRAPRRRPRGDQRGRRERPGRRRGPAGRPRRLTRLSGRRALSAGSLAAPPTPRRSAARACRARHRPSTGTRTARRPR